MPRRSELGWILVMVMVAVTLGFFIGGGPSLLTQRGDDVGGAVAAAGDTTTTTAANGSTSTTTVATTTTTTTAIATRPASEVRVRVYNGSTKAGQAVRVGDRLKAAGYQVLTPGASPGDPFARSVIHFAEGFSAEAAALAGTLGLPATAAAPAPDPPVVSGVGDAQLVVIVADDLVLSA